MTTPPPVMPTPPATTSPSFGGRRRVGVLCRLVLLGVDAAVVWPFSRFDAFSSGMLRGLLLHCCSFRWSALVLVFIIEVGPFPLAVLSLLSYARSAIGELELELRGPVGK